MKFGKLIEYNMRNIFLGKSYTECGSGKIKIDCISGSIFESFIQFVFIVCQLDDSKYVETKLQTACFYVISSFLKNKEVWN